ncbi:MAG: galactokinase [Hyphomicrobiales bacterium]|nr:MAG: galactokinase [Hyphomicrobiales bacterium]
MLITRTPLRISIGGGGSDLPSFYEKFGGFFVSAAIDKYIYISITRHFTNDYIIRYSEQEKVRSIAEIKHRIVKAVLSSRSVEPVEVVSIADLPSGTGLGSSGSFTVGLLRAVYGHQRESVTAHRIAEEACTIEMKMLGDPVGKQDQFIASFGGLTCFEIDKDGTVHVAPLRLPQKALHGLEDNLLLFFTGYSRSASTLLQDQQKKSAAMDAEMINGLQATVELGREINRQLVSGNVSAFGDLMHEHWLRKRARSAGMSNGDIDRWYDVARAGGARGGKLVGAGGGGFLLLYADDPSQLRQAMASEGGPPEVRFKFDFDGSVVISRG